MCPEEVEQPDPYASQYVPKALGVSAPICPVQTHPRKNSLRSTHRRHEKTLISPPHLFAGLRQLCLTRRTVDRRCHDPGTRHQLRGSKGTLGGRVNQAVLQLLVLARMADHLGLRDQMGCGRGHGLGQLHQDVLKRADDHDGEMTRKGKFSHAQNITLTRSIRQVQRPGSIIPCFSRLTYANFREEHCYLKKSCPSLVLTC